MTTLIIARHGNTFTPEQTPTRVGARTNLPLVESGRTQARALGRALKERGLLPDLVYTSHLMRTQETATLALESMGIDRPVTPLEMLNEIDYGVDENQPEDHVIARIGAQALKDWDTHGIVPQGWAFDPLRLQKDWIAFAKGLPEGKIILAVTSNGAARFAPIITGNLPQFQRDFTPKLATSAYGILQHSGKFWVVTEWNTRPTL